MTKCPAPRREGDETVCGRCGLRWGVDEDKPPCPGVGVGDIQDNDPDVWPPWTEHPEEDYIYE